jgi:hypothetical protein
MRKLALAALVLATAAVFLAPHATGSPTPPSPPAGTSPTPTTTPPTQPDPVASQAALVSEGDTAPDGTTASGYTPQRCATKNFDVPAGSITYRTVMQICLEARNSDNAYANKTRFTFYQVTATGTTGTSGNVRWDVKWGDGMYRRVRNLSFGGVVSYTSNRPDAIGVHSTVGWSQWGCPPSLDTWYDAYTYRHTVRLANGSLLGPLSLSSGQVNGSPCTRALAGARPFKPTGGGERMLTVAMVGSAVVTVIHLFGWLWG